MSDQIIKIDEDGKVHSPKVDAQGQPVYAPPNCQDSTHRWRADYDSGDTCQCGALYLTHAKDGIVEVSES